MILNSNPDQVNPAKEKSTFPEKPLQSWKEIAAYLERDERTARRWEKTAGLPVRRHHDGPRSTVYAYPTELEAWRSTRKPKASQIQSRRWGPFVAIALFGIVLATWFIFYGPVLNPPNPLVEAAEGITLRQVWAEPGVDDMGDVSLDGRLLTYTDWNTGNLAIRNLDAETTRRITDKGSWAESDEFSEYSIISPNGRRIAYSWYNEEDDYELRLSEVDRSDPQILYHCEGEEWVKPIDWVPGGNKILAGLFQGPLLVRLVLVGLMDQAVDSVASSIWRGADVTLALSPDGKHIVFDDRSEGSVDQRDVFIIPIGGGAPVKLVKHPADDYMPIWSPDGNNVLFASDRTGSAGLWMIRVEQGRSVGDPKLVKGEIGPLRSIIGFTKKGDLYYSLSAGSEDIYFFEIDPEQGKVLRQPTKLAGRHIGANMGPVFSPDGRFVAYHFQHAPQVISPGALALVVRSLRTGEEREIRPRLIQYGPVQWFPDGESFLIPVMRSPQERTMIDYYRMDLKNGETELIRQSKPKKFASYRPCLSGDGNSVYFTESEVEGPQRGLTVIKRLVLEFGQEQVIHRLPNGKSARSIQLSPDGQTMAWVEWNREPTYFSVNTRPVKGGDTREILRPKQPEYLRTDGSIAWAPDGQYLLVSQFSGEENRSELFRLPLNGGEPAALGVTMDRILFGDVHNNGRLVAFYSGQQKGRAREIWAMEGFLAKETTSK